VSNVAAALQAGKCVEEEECHYFPSKRHQGEVTRQIDPARGPTAWEMV